MFITLEGIEGCGKSTQSKRLGQALPDALLTREPGSTPLGVAIREVLLSRGGAVPVPPGSHVSTARSPSHWQRSGACVLLPQPSMPSRVMNVTGSF